MAYIFDLDQTIVDSSIAERYRNQRQWSTVYTLIPQFRLYEGLDEIFKILHERGEKICVVTSSPEKYCRTVLKQFNIRADCIVCYHDTKFHKPHPDPILKAVELLGGSPQDIISIGDVEKDIVASNAAGVISCLALWGGQAADANSNVAADYVFETVADLKQYIITKGEISKL